jgi:hypothetical protein
MLQPISQLTPEQRIDALISRPNWVAVCKETGAHLSVSQGRSRYGSGRKYILILPKAPGKLFDYGEWDNEDRKMFKAHSLTEAVETANEKLEKMLAKRATVTA